MRLRMVITPPPGWSTRSERIDGRGTPIDPWTTTTERTVVNLTLASLAERQHTAIGVLTLVTLARGTFSVFLDCFDLDLGA